MGPKFIITGKEEFVPQKILYVEIDDEITFVYDRLKKLKFKRVALLVPKRAQLFQSAINLKILKKKTDELEKEVLIVTTDAIGLQMAEKSGFLAVSKLSGGGGGKKSAAPAAEPGAAMRPLRKNTGKEKLSLAEIVNTDKIRPWEHIMERVREHLKKRKLDGMKTKIVLVAPNKQALFTLILVSILLLLTIAYIALPGATITLTPRPSVLDSSVNVTFFQGTSENIGGGTSGSSRGAVVIAGIPLSPPPFQKKFTHPATGKLFQGENARGIITVINESGAPWELAVRTRFQTNEGIIFRTPEAVRVPAAVAGTPGKLRINVVADEFDIDGQVVGTRGNISPSKFFLPGLRTEESRRKLHAESEAPMMGGITKTTKIVSKEDIEAAQETARREIMKGAVDDLARYLAAQNIADKTNLSLLTDRNLIEISDITIEIPPQTEGKTTEQFEVEASYRASGIAFDRSELVLALKERLKNRADPNKKIVQYEEDDISYQYLDGDERKTRVRLTATMRAIQMYDLDPESENGKRFLKKITDHIAGMRIAQAIAYLQQQTDEIARVEINTWPVWAPTIPNIAKNIKFLVKEEGFAP